MSSQSGPDRAAASLTGAFRPAQGAYEARGPIQFEVINLLPGRSVLLRALLREEGPAFQRVKTWKTSRDPDYAARKARVEHLCAIADGEVMPEGGEPGTVFRLDDFGPLNAPGDLHPPSHVTVRLDENARALGSPLPLPEGEG
ncbi:hypothetical protein JO379_000573 [Streptomyces syringium]|uniref:Uncharacterized protein n=1 Tax=Streptomyces syringium TaxID=76729 RepID=A0ABS4XX73_9ACTN|nr:hypothetical protein [Streptomyces syringium]